MSARLLGEAARPRAMKLEQWMRAAAARLVNSDTPHLDVRVLAAHSLGLDAAGLIAAADRALTSAEAATLGALVERRAAGEPVAYIVGEKEFFGLNFRMARGVLVPRPETESLVEAAIEQRGARSPQRILDLGTGSGCILLALLSAFPMTTGIGIDINPAAIALSEENAVSLGLAGRASWIAGPYERAPAGQFDIIVSNPPYIRESERNGLAPEVRDHEDPRALFGGEDGLDAYRRILAVAPARIAAQGLIILELGAGAAEPVKRLVREVFPAARISLRADLSGTLRALTVDLEKRD